MEDGLCKHVSLPLKILDEVAKDLANRKCAEGTVQEKDSSITHPMFILTDERGSLRFLNCTLVHVIFSLKPSNSIAFQRIPDEYYSNWGLGRVDLNRVTGIHWEGRSIQLSMMEWGTRPTFLTFVPPTLEEEEGSNLFKLIETILELNAEGATRPIGDGLEIGKELDRNTEVGPPEASNLISQMHSLSLPDGNSLSIPIPMTLLYVPSFSQDWLNATCPYIELTIDSANKDGSDRTITFYPMLVITDFLDLDCYNYTMAEVNFCEKPKFITFARMPRAKMLSLDRVQGVQWELDRIRMSLVDYSNRERFIVLVPVKMDKFEEEKLTQLFKDVLNLDENGVCQIRGPF